MKVMYLVMYLSCTAGRFVVDTFFLFLFLLKKKTMTSNHHPSNRRRFPFHRLSVTVQLPLVALSGAVQLCA